MRDLDGEISIFGDSNSRQAPLLADLRSEDPASNPISYPVSNSGPNLINERRRDGDEWAALVISRS